MILTYLFQGHILELDKEGFVWITSLESGKKYKICLRPELLVVIDSILSYEELEQLRRL